MILFPRMKERFIIFLLLDILLFLDAQILDIGKLSKTLSKITCAPNERPSFIKLPHDGTRPIGAAEVVIPGQNLIDCAQFCMENQNGLGSTFGCAAFDYIYKSNSCMLSGSGPSPDEVLPKRKDGPKFAGAGFHQTGFYQKICLRALSASYVSSNTSYTFERTPMMVLLGSTEEIVKADTLAQCLGACLEANDLFDFLCRSAMYYYETRDCLLNINDQTTSLQPMSNDTEGFLVDYFENHVVSAECGPGTVPQYMILMGKDMIKEHDFIMQGVTRRTCQHFCTTNRADSGQVFMCKAYAYKSSDMTCYLMDEKARPGGPGKVATVDGVEIYEKICLSAENTCVQSPAFERVPDHVLIGSAKVILEDIKSYERCLSECMRSESTLQFYCLSAMYYFETGECVLNTDNRLSATGHNSFSNDTGATPVDYYDNLCMDSNIMKGIPTNACPLDSHSSFIEYFATEQPEFHRQTYSGVTVQKCLLLCEKELNFTCNSVDYREIDATCTLSHVDSRTSPLLGVDDTNHYERHCLQGTQFVCRNLAVSFSASPSQRLDVQAFLNVSGISLDECLSVCLQDPAATCQSINYHKPASRCQLNAETSDLGVLVDDKNTDYYQSQCTGAAEIQRAPTPFLGETLAQVRDVEIITDCQYGGMKITAASSEPFSGYIFTKNKFGSCRTDVENDSVGELMLNFPADGFQPHGAGISQGHANQENGGHGHGTNEGGGGYPQPNVQDSYSQQGQQNQHNSGYEQQNFNNQNSFSSNQNQGGYQQGSYGNPSSGSSYNQNQKPPVQPSFQGYGVSPSPSVYPTPPVNFPQGSYQPQAQPSYGNPFPANEQQFPTGYPSLPGVSPAPYPSNQQAARPIYGPQSPQNQQTSYQAAGPTQSSYQPAQQPQHYNQSASKPQPSYPPGAKLQPSNQPSYNPAPQPSYEPATSQPINVQPKYPAMGVQEMSATVRDNSGDELFFQTLSPIIIPGKEVNQKLAPEEIENNEIDRYSKRVKRVVKNGYVPQEGDCGVREISRMKYSAIVIVTTNNLGVPGLVTDEDKFYNVTCDYTSSAQSKVIATAPGIAVSNPPSIPALQPDGQIYIPAPIIIKLQRNGQDVSMATLGEPLELKFDYVQSFNVDTMGVFIRQCNASRAYGYPPHPEPLVLIEDGCPMPAVQQAIVPGSITQDDSGFSLPFTVFKFDGGPTVKISCAVDFCEGQCNPTTCNINGNNESSFGKRRKRSMEKLMPESESVSTAKIQEKFRVKKAPRRQPKDKKSLLNLNKTKKKSPIRTLIFTVVDKLPPNDGKVSPNNNPKHFDDRQSGNSNQQKGEKLQNYVQHATDASKSGTYVSINSLDDLGFRQICLRKSSFLSLFLFLGGLCFVQVCVIATYFIRKLLQLRFADKKDASESTGKKKLLKNKHEE